MKYKGLEGSLFNAGRVMCVKKLESLSVKFESDTLFSIYVRPHTMISVDVVIMATPAYNDSPVEVPVECNSWSTVMFSSINSNENILTENDIFIGWGIKAK
jgi:hypothetical protein